ncbi:hypothetical protein AGLY_004397 [Aphis glycines]|uniref:MADF domain-containing protein n=1 Tax=Aphis glycines TaxID=307491 RepID=A0A6G0TXY7_APHGL|nr:hypothetical protein AGLY_004397 [Aphis glycines]
MVFDTDKFISCIQNNPSIWEIGSKDYMDRNIKQQSWNTIGEYMFENWSELKERAKQNKESLSFLQHVIKKRRYSNPKSKKQNKCKVQKITQFQRELLKNVSTSEEDVTSDPDKASLFSLLSDYKHFRLMTLQYFRNISLGSNQLQPTPPSYNINQNTTQILPTQTQYSNVYSSEFNPGLGYNQNHNLMLQRPQPLPYTSSYNYTSDQSQQPNTSGEMYGNFDNINK